MSIQVRVRERESIQAALKRFKKLLKRSQAELTHGWDQRQRLAGVYVKPSEVRHRLEYRKRIRAKYGPKPQRKKPNSTDHPGSSVRRESG